MVMEESGDLLPVGPVGPLLNGARESVESMSEIAYNSRRQDADKMREIVSVPSEPDRGKDNSRRCNTDRPDEGQREKIDYSETLDFGCDRSSRRCEYEHARQDICGGHAGQIGQDHGNLEWHEHVQKIAAADIDHGRNSACDEKS